MKSRWMTSQRLRPCVIQSMIKPYNTIYYLGFDGSHSFTSCYLKMQKSNLNKIWGVTSELKGLTLFVSCTKRTVSFKGALIPFSVVNQRWVKNGRAENWPKLLGLTTQWIIEIRKWIIKADLVVFHIRVEVSLIAVVVFNLVLFQMNTLKTR